MTVEYDFAAKMKENREQWNVVGISNVTILVPEGLKPYLKALSLMMCAEHLLEAIETHNVDIMEAFANRQPRTSVTLEALDSIKAQAGVSEEVVSRVDDLIRLLREKRAANSEGMRAASEGDSTEAMYHMAREYAITYYIRGAHAMLELAMGVGIPKIKEY